MDPTKSIKIVGHRRSTARGAIAFERVEGFLKLLLELRKGKSYIPKGVYRFKTFEEKEQWRMKMLLGKKPGHQQ